MEILFLCPFVDSLIDCAADATPPHRSLWSVLKEGTAGNLPTKSEFPVLGFVESGGRLAHQDYGDC